MCEERPPASIFVRSYDWLLQIGCGAGDCCFKQLCGMNFKGIEYNGIKYKLRDVPGDGNCLFHALVCSKVIQRNSLQLRTIAESFNKCGLNPYSLDTDLKSFRRHLDSLNEVKAYDLLIEANHHEEFKASLESILN
jgi:hypothetical protein